MCFISYNQSGYSTHCRQYAEYQEWVSNRDPKRYESNLEKNYDSKNMTHCFRLMHMAAEIAEGRGVTTCIRRAIYLEEDLPIGETYSKLINTIIKANDHASKQECVDTLQDH